MFHMIPFLMILGLLIAGCAHVDTGPAELEDSASGDTGEFMGPSTDIPNPADFVMIDEEPVQIKEDRPIFPQKAMEAHANGEVIVQAFVGTEGKVLRVNVLKCSRPGMGFEEAAVKAAHKSRWRPAKLQGKPVGIWVAYTVKFENPPFEGIH